MSKKRIGGIIAGAVIVGGLALGGLNTVKIDPGYIGIIYDATHGGVNGETMKEGWNFKTPTQKVTEYSIALEQSYLTKDDKGDSDKDESFNIPTSDGKSINVDVEFSYRFDEDRITEIFKTFKGKSGESIKNTFIKPKIIAWSQEVSAKYPVTDVFGDKRQELNQALDDYLKAKFDKYGIIIDTVNFTRIETDEETTAAIQKKVTAQQDQELATIEAKTAKINAEKEKEVALITAEQNKETAQINAEQAKIKAEGQAEATKIAAEAEAEANKKIAESLTPELIEKIKMERWNGELPMVSGSSGTIINMTDDANETTVEEEK